MGLKGAEMSTVVWKFVGSFSMTLEKLVLATGRSKTSETLSKHAEASNRRRFALLRYVAFEVVSSDSCCLSSCRRSVPSLLTSATR